MKNMKITIAMLVVLIITIGGNCYAVEEFRVDEAQLQKAGLTPFEPKLLWEKDFGKGEIFATALAGDSGDVLVHHRNKSIRLQLFDKNGKKLWTQGPIEKIYTPSTPHISDDGKIITYEMANWDTDFTVLFYVDRNNKKKWQKEIRGSSVLSPDGKWIAVIPAADTGKTIVLMDSSGKEFMKKEYDWAGNGQAMFSADSQYVAITDSNRIPGKVDKNDNPKKIHGGVNYYWIYDKNGKIIFESAIKIRDWASFSATGLFSIKSPPWSATYDLKGKKVIDGFSMVSGDGKVAVIITPAKVTVINPQTKEKLKEYAIATPHFADEYYAFLSYSGKYLGIVLSEKGYANTEGLVVNLQTGRYYKESLVYDDVFKPQVFSKGIYITKDERYLVTEGCGMKKNTIRYYQLP